MLLRANLGSRDASLAAVLFPEELGRIASQCALDLEHDVKLIELAAADEGQVMIEITGGLTAAKLGCATTSKIGAGGRVENGPSIIDLPGRRVRLTTAPLGGDLAVGERTAKAFAPVPVSVRFGLAVVTPAAELVATVEGEAGSATIRLADAAAARDAVAAVTALREKGVAASARGPVVTIRARTVTTFTRALRVFFELLPVSGGSMRPTLGVGEVVVVTRARLAGAPRPGDVVLFEDADSGQRMIKRVLGVAGDRVQLDGSALRVNGQLVVAQRLEPRVMFEDGEGQTTGELWQEQLGDLKYRVFHASVPPTAARVDVTVPEDTVFVVGDSRDASRDSRHFGPVPVAQVLGRVDVVVWSPLQGAPRWDRIGRRVR